MTDIHCNVEPVYESDDRIKLSQKMTAFRNTASYSLVEVDDVSEVLMPPKSAPSHSPP
jgi:hypothetical protein